jgi:Ser/Thr protein kinase RdoA (MazF antagonist)
MVTTNFSKLSFSEFLSMIDVIVTAEKVEKILLQPIRKVSLVKKQNHTFLIETKTDHFYLKIFTKDWYGNDQSKTGGCVEHEESAWKILRSHQIAAPEVVSSSRNCLNPIGCPYIMTNELSGSSLTSLLQKEEQPEPLLFAVGNYLKRIHAIQFPQSGYLMEFGPNNDPSDTGWKHPIWDPTAWQKNALFLLEHEKDSFSPSLLQSLYEIFSNSLHILSSAYIPPRFTHGDCWAEQFFLEKIDNSWEVTGVVDMEVASAGDCESDLIHLFLQIASLMKLKSHWWKMFFEGYQSEPDFLQFQTRLLATTEAEFQGMWPGSRIERLAHILSSCNYSDLFSKGIWSKV